MTAVPRTNSNPRLKENTMTTEYGIRTGWSGDGEPTVAMTGAQPARRPPTTGDSARLSLANLVGAEWLKLRSLRAAMLAACSAVLLGAGAGVGQLFLYKLDAQHRSLSAKQVMAESIASGRYGMLIGLAVLGVLVIGSEYGTGAIRGTFVGAPRRLEVIAAKAVVVSALAAATAVLALGSVGIAAIPVMADAGLGEVPIDGVLAAVATSAGFAVLVTVFALFVTLLVRSTAVGVGATLGTLLVLPILLNVVANVTKTDLTAFGFTSAASSVFTDPISGALPAVLAWLAVPALLGGGALIRRDA
jgi:ABC-2 type transport system permease protein